MKGAKLWGESVEEDRWVKLENIIRRVVKEELSAHGFKAKTKLSFEGGRWIGITDEQLEAWKAAYGAVDLTAELNKAAAWILSNPHVAPKSQFGRFLNTWFSRQQNVLSIRAIPTRNESLPPRNCAYCDLPASGSVNGIKHCQAHVMDAMDQKPSVRRA